VNLREGIFGVYRRVVRLFTGTGIGDWPPIRAAHNWMVRRFKPEMVVVHGIRMYTDDIDSLALTIHGEYEEFETELVLQSVREGQVVVDIGANIGYYTLLLASRVGVGGRVYAFEPEPGNFELLEKNVAANSLSNVVLERAAVSDHDGPLTLSISFVNRGDHRILDGPGGRRDVKVAGVTLDRALPPSQKISFVKMDIQGAEGLALRGMKETLRNNPEIRLAMEFWPRRLSECGCGPAECLDILDEMGFRTFWIDESRRRLVPVSREWLLGMKMDQVNLLADRRPAPGG
jgi:FkbM family methyltransferase